ncbi:class I SAM-dependent methyltransferase [Streptomyces bacillaris]|uniref:Class I SAM-dependent methyltransferase n=1 Tax=Streptomyces cavourensis TaxID=67258 RepID=A0ABY5FFF6_9ACTN|nr:MULTISPECIES: class I SAM-dependent methyltransferase [Streptomyces]NUV87875.1 class I SAM-dependent methyltransferase [Streptomyces sp. KAI-26]NUW20193.1 class I SAM-dependent methyltransferase [Streptomyces roseoviolaceus]UTR82447.1 class I SAM-dependent methyltransferase [Streptomyces cavourensis]
MNTTADARTTWDGIYAARPAATDPRPNVRLTEAVAELPPGDALELGCGEGGDTLWLARRGWRVTAVDLSAVAVERLNALARSHGLADRVTAEQHDLGASFPEAPEAPDGTEATEAPDGTGGPDGGFDLVTAHYLHTPFDLDRSAVLRRAAHALRPGGRLLVVDHGSTAPWSWNQDPDVRFPSPREVAEGLALDPAGWTVERADAPRRTATGPDGTTAEVTDHVLCVRRVRRTDGHA